VNYLLDTNSWVDHLRHGPNSKVTVRLMTVPPGSVFLCSIVLGELLYGAYHSGPAHQASNLALIALLRRQFVSLPLDERCRSSFPPAIRTGTLPFGVPVPVLPGGPHGSEL
jgi:predicted nucleic acid-binding protein